MKKIILLFILLFQLTFVFAQNSQWGSWTPVSCYSRLSTSILGNGYVPSIKEYSWQVRIKSTYSKKVTFNMTWIVGGERLSIGQVTLSPNESYGHTPRYFKSSSNNIVVEVSEVCFEGQDCYKYGYADCNGNQAKITNNSSSTNSTNSTNQTNTSNQQTTQQNDLSEYNRSKADLERQMNEKNAEGQQKSQNYTNAMNAGISAHNAGNYEEAKRQFSIALNNSNTEVARQKAQEYYNKIQVKIQDLNDDKNRNSSTTEQLENIIFSNLKTNLIEAIQTDNQGNTWKYSNISISVIDEKIYLKYTNRIKYGSRYEAGAFTNNSYEAIIPFMELSVTLLDENTMTSYNGTNQSLLSIDGYSNNHPGLKCKNYITTQRSSSAVSDNCGDFKIAYNSGINDSNFIELKNAIEALKNPNQNLGGSSKQSGDVQKTEVVKKNELNSDELFQKAEQLMFKEFDTLKAIEYYEASAKKGNANAMNRIGGFYFCDFIINGKIICENANLPKAKYWFEMAAKNGSTNAMKNLSSIYGKSNDFVNSNKWLFMAAEKNDSLAMLMIGVYYRNGENGLIKSSEKAKIWFTKACESVDKLGCKYLDEL